MQTHWYRLAIFTWATVVFCAACALVIIVGFVYTIRQIWLIRRMPDGPKYRGRRPEARHVLPGNELDHTERRDVGMHADAAGGRLRDSTARFFCTPQQMPHRQARQQTLEDDGLTTTQRTSTVIGVGLNPAAEIKSIGVRENFTESVYAIRRRNSNMDPRTALGRANLRQASQANAMQQSASHAAEKARSEDVAMVAALK